MTGLGQEGRAALVCVVVAVMVAAVARGLPALVSTVAMQGVLRVRRALIAGVIEGRIPASDPVTRDVLDWCIAATEGTAGTPPTACREALRTRLQDRAPVGAAVLESLLRDIAKLDLLVRTERRLSRRVRWLPPRPAAAPGLPSPARNDASARHGSTADDGVTSRLLPARAGLPGDRSSVVEIQLPKDDDETAGAPLDQAPQLPSTASEAVRR